MTKQNVKRQAIKADHDAGKHNPPRPHTCRWCAKSAQLVSAERLIDLDEHDKTAATEAEKYLEY
jgi:hypothetical protein